MGNSNRSVHMGSTILVQTVKMQTCRLIPKRVLYIDNDPIAFVGDDGWNRPLSIDALNWTVCLAIRVRICPSQVKVVGDSCRARS